MKTRVAKKQAKLFRKKYVCIYFGEEQNLLSHIKIEEEEQIED